VLLASLEMPSKDSGFTGALESLQGEIRTVGFREGLEGYWVVLWRGKLDRSLGFEFACHCDELVAEVIISSLESSKVFLVELKTV
jgi:hypothetical protein